MFYDLVSHVYIDAEALAWRGLPEDPQKLALLGIYRIIEELVPYDPAWQGVEPYGQPELTPGLLLVQSMRAFNLLSSMKTRRISALAAKRWQRQCAGIWLCRDGRKLFVQTTPNDLQRLGNTIQGMELGRLDATFYKSASGWLEVRLIELKEIFAEANAYTQACYQNEAAIAARIEIAASFTELNLVDSNAGWPDRGETASDMEDSEVSYQEGNR